jgi:ABC-type glycerol-3-phosphate transport system substrate-binding protein
MQTPSSLFRFAVLASFLGAAACGGGGSGGGTGTVALTMTDAPFPATEGCLSAAWIEVDRVEVRGPNGFVDVALTGATDGVVRIDLLQLRSGLADSLALGDVPTGAYDQVRLHVVESELEFEDGSPPQPFKVPSGMSSGLKINIKPPILVATGQTTPLMLDFDLSSSFHTTALGGNPTCDELKAGEGGVIFRPLVRAVNTSETAMVSGVVTDSALTPVADVEVTAFLNGTVVDGTTVPAASTFSAPAGLANVAAGSYAIFLEPGTYDLYLRAQGETDRTLAVSSLVVTPGVITQDLTFP